MHPCRRRGGAGSMKPRMEPTISSWPPRCIRCRRLHSRRCHPGIPAKTSPAPPPPAVVRPGSAASSRSDFVSKLPAPPLGLLSKSGAKQTTPTNPRSKLKTFDYSKQNGRSPTVISEDKEPADAAADKAALTNAARPMSQGARVRSTTAAGYKKNTPPETRKIQSNRIRRTRAWLRRVRR